MSMRSLSEGERRLHKMSYTLPKKKLYVIQFPKPMAIANCGGRSWHNGGDIEIGLYGRSLRKARKPSSQPCT